VQDFSEETKELLTQFTGLKAALPKLKGQETYQDTVCGPEEFEKDNDANFHIDYMHAVTNCRAANYKLEAMDFLTVKLKAGRIIPALATTTASIAGLQTLEVCKVLRTGLELEAYQNCYLNLALP